MTRLALFLLALFLTLPAKAGELTLEGAFSQGGIIFGRTAPGAKVVMQGQKVRVSAGGSFVFGFGRDWDGPARLTVTYPDGTVEKRDLEVAKREYKIQRIDGLPKRQVSPPESVWKRIQAENAKIGAVRKVDRDQPYFESGFAWPAIGVVSGVYGSQRVLNGVPKRPHYGLDVAAPVGTPVVAPADGVIVLVETDLYYTGGTIILDHGHGLTSAFLHMSKVTAELGQTVRQGDKIGEIGAAGRATGPHLDWRMNWFKQRVDPAFLVGPMPKAE